MNARTIPQSTPQGAPDRPAQGTSKTTPRAAPPASAMPRFDRKFIEDHQLVERYLENKLPFKGARDLENWCRANPDYLNELKLAERAQTSLKLLEFSGRPQDLREPKAPWWKSIYVSIGSMVAAALSLLAFWALLGKYELLRGELEDTRTQMNQGTLIQPATTRTLRIAPDRAPGIDRARITVSRNAPQLIDLHIDMGYTAKMNQFRLLVDKKDQGRALILDNLLKDSNGELGMTLNSTGLAAGIYNARIEALPMHGSPIPVGWLTLEVR